MPKVVMTPSVGHNLDRGDAGASAFIGADSDPFPITGAEQALAFMRSDGWTVVGVACLVDQSSTFADIYALKPFAGFTASAVMSISSKVITVSAYAPFHTEKPDPWFPGGQHAPAKTCIDGPDVPKETTPSLDTNIGSIADVP